MTQRDLDRLRRGEITEMPLPPVNLPPEPNWEAIEHAINLSDPDFSAVEAQVRGLLASLSEFRVQYEETVVASLNTITSEIRAIRREAQYQAKTARQMMETAQKGYARLEQQFLEQVRKTAEAANVTKEAKRSQEIRKAQRPPPAPRPVKAKNLPAAPCWARSAEPAGKLNCGCQGAAVAYECSHPQVGGFVTLHAASLRDSILRKPDGTQLDMQVRHLSPCSLCQYRGTAKDTLPLVTSIVLSTRTVICDACQRKSECPVPASEQLTLPTTSCPDGFWPAEVL